MRHIGEEGAFSLIGHFCFFSGGDCFIPRDFQFMSALGHLSCQNVFSTNSILPLPDECPGYQANDQQRGQPPEPSGLPPGRANSDRNRCPLFVPYSMIIGTLNSKEIVARRQIGVCCKTSFGTHFIPGIFQSFQDIAIAVLLRGGITEGNKFKGEDILVVAQGNVFCGPDGLLQNGIVTRNNRLVEQLKAG